MFLGSYEFTGDPKELLEAYDRLSALMGPESLYFHACVVGDAGITVFDACPSQEVFASFAGGDFFADVLRKVGLPSPKVTQLGDLHATVPAMNV
jgi:hypothetical protein